ncbi:MAG: GTPase Era [Gammaproteobacteria bacterium]|nr:GTPase Era [Gammaproteobacteria bacterium]|tara:strand:+ start:1284 stop:2180 length:897 start_codon:yes stop_codon:yes gene_type:complete
MVTRCGYVALVGRPNVGKSTLLNHLLRQKLSITSRKPQTTRHVLLGVDTEGDHQAIYVDTPGIHDHARREMNRQMVRAATAVLADVDLVLMVLDRDTWTPADELVLEHLKAHDVPCFAVINKVDLMPRKDALLPLIAELDGRGAFEEIFPVSALRGAGLDDLRRAVFARLPEQAHLFPPDQVTDSSERFLVSEIVREKLMRRLGDEVPHHLTVVIDAYDETPTLVDIAATVYVERSGQKRIVIGQGGERIKQVGQEAREDVERLLEKRVMLRLWVKVRAGWSQTAAGLRRVGYDPGSG